MPALMLYPDGSRTEFSPENGRHYKMLELNLRFGLGHITIVNLYGFLFVYNLEGEELFSSSGGSVVAYAYNPHASAILTTHLKAVHAIFGPVIFVPMEEMEP